MSRVDRARRQSAVREGQRLPIRHDGRNRAPANRLLAASSMANANVGTDDESRKARPGTARAPPPRPSGRDVKYAVSRGDLSRSQHRWHEEARPIPDVPSYAERSMGRPTAAWNPGPKCTRIGASRVLVCHTPSALWPREMMCDLALPYV